MKAIILSAGKGTRLWPLTKNKPKILVELGDGTTVLSRQVKNLSQLGYIDELIIGSGHCVEKIEEAVKSYDQIPIQIIYNPFYDISGPLVTLWVVLSRITQPDFIILNGDTIFSMEVFAEIERALKNCNEGLWLVTSEVNNFSEDDVKVCYSSEYKIINVGKNIPDNIANGVSAGLLIVKGAQTKSKFFTLLDKISRNPEFLKHDKTWHSFLNDLIFSGHDIHSINVKPDHWAEVDLHLDLKEIQDLLKPKVNF